MRTQLLSTIIACAACLAWGAQAQSATDPSSGSSPTSPSSTTTPGSSGSYQQGASGWSSRHMSPTGRMGHEAVRGSQLTGAQVKNSSGSDVGTISDTIIDPASGRVECAVISLSGGASGASSSSSSSSTSPGSSTSTTPGASSSSSLGSGKQVAVPWMLLRPSASAGSSSGLVSTSGTSGQQPSFTFAGDASKLESAPNFDANTDLSQPSWRQSIFSYFGLSGRGFGGTGAAETPGGSSSSSSGSQGSQSSTGKP